MSNEFWVGIAVQIAMWGVGIGSIYGVIKTRLDYMEKKLDKHNNFIERVYKVEEDIKLLDEKQKVANHRIQDLEGVR